MITIEQLKQFAPPVGKNDIRYTELVAAINETMGRHDISTAQRIRFFMTHAFHESAGFTKFAENLYYSTPEQLVRVWPKRFTLDPDDHAKIYAATCIKSPEKLANVVYANRIGNGGPDSGDGNLFRGRGIFGLTFRANYAAYSEDTYKDDRIVLNPALVSEYKDGVESAGWFWTKNKLNTCADTDAFERSTVIIQGSASSVPERRHVLGRASSIF
jgi:putative chitinase